MASYVVMFPPFCYRNFLCLTGVTADESFDSLRMYGHRKPPSLPRGSLVGQLEEEEGAEAVLCPYPPTLYFDVHILNEFSVVRILDLYHIVVGMKTVFYFVVYCDWYKDFSFFLMVLVELDSIRASKPSLTILLR